jgi:uncharacterized membrane protein YhaH (DUF805 family)
VSQDSSAGGWHPDPAGRHQFRWYDGNRWTSHVASEGVSGVDELDPTPVAQPQQYAPAQPPAVAPQPAATEPARGSTPAAAAPAAPAGSYGTIAKGTGTGHTPVVTGIPDAVKVVVSKYADFTGRATRGEYWWFFLAMLLVYVALAALGAVSEVFVAIYGLVVLGALIPGLALAVRRMHDLDKSGWALLLGLIPVVGPIILLVLACTQGTPGPNRYGPPAQT